MVKPDSLVEQINNYNLFNPKHVHRCFTAHFRYLKGRITYDQVNKFIDGMNKAYVTKYKLLKQKKSSLNDMNRKRYEKYKSQETKDTAGTIF